MCCLWCNGVEFHINVVKPSEERTLSEPCGAALWTLPQWRQILCSHTVVGGTAQWLPFFWHLTSATLSNNPLTWSSLRVIFTESWFLFYNFPLFLFRPGGVRPPVCKPDGRKPDGYQSVWRAPVQSAVWPDWSGHGQIQQGGRLATE